MLSAFALLKASIGTSEHKGMADRVRIRVTDDGMRVFVSVKAGDTASGDDLREALDGAGVRHGVLEESLELFVEKIRDPAFTSEEILIAEGTRAVKGEDGFFSPAFLGEFDAGRVRDDGSIDFRDRNSLISASPNEVLGLYRGPTEGEPGSNVLGEEVPAQPGKDLPPRLGAGAEMRDDGRVVATSAGVVSYRPGATLAVSDALEHRGDVDLKSGDLKLVGSLVVTGAVTQNAKVISTGDIVIKGMVDGGSVESDGSIVVMGGVVGEETALVRSGGDIVCRHSQGARIECTETLTIEQHAVNSFLKARVILGGTSRTRVLGGAALAVEKIVVGEAGSKLGARTALSVAVPLNWAYKSATSKLKGRRPKPGQKSAGKSDRARQPTNRKAEGGEQKRLLGMAFVEVIGTVYPGVVIEIGHLSLTVDKETRGVRFSYSAEDEPCIVTEPCISKRAP